LGYHLLFDYVFLSDSLFFHDGVESILDHMLSACFTKFFGYFAPTQSIVLYLFHQFYVFLSSPFLFQNVRVKMVLPSVSACFRTFIILAIRLHKQLIRVFFPSIQYCFRLNDVLENSDFFFSPLVPDIFIEDVVELVAKEELFFKWKEAVDILKLLLWLYNSIFYDLTNIEVISVAETNYEPNKYFLLSRDPKLLWL